MGKFSALCYVEGQTKAVMENYWHWCYIWH